MMKLEITKEWCTRMANLEGDSEIGVGKPMDITDKLRAEIERTVDLDLMHHDAANELERLRAEVASLKEELLRSHNIGANTALNLLTVTQQLAAANSRVERMRQRLQDALEQIVREPQETMSDGKALRAIIKIAKRAISDLPEASQPIRDETQDFSDF